MTCPRSHSYKCWSLGLNLSLASKSLFFSQSSKIKLFVKCYCDLTQIRLYEVCPEGIQPFNMKNRDIYWRRYKIQETLYRRQRHLSPLQIRHLGTSHSSPSHHQLPHCISLNLTDGLKSLPFQRWFLFWGKAEVTGRQIWAVGVLSHLGNLMFHQKTLHERWCLSGCFVVMKPPITSCL